MCIIFTCGEHTFRKEVEGYEGVVCRCHNCGNYSGNVVKSHPWFTFCFIVSAQTPRPLPSDRQPGGLQGLGLVLFPKLTLLLAPHPIVHPRLRGHRMPSLQLPATAQPPARCSGDEERRGRDPITTPRRAAAAAWRTAWLAESRAKSEPANGVQVSKGAAARLGKLEQELVAWCWDTGSGGWKTAQAVVQHL